MRHRFRGALTGLRAACALAAFSVAAGSGPAGADQSAPPTVDPRVAPGRQLLDRLDAAPDRRSAILADAGESVAAAQLAAVVAHGQQPGAAAADWRDLHRALDALIGIHEANGDYLKAGTYAMLQDSTYRNFEEDYASALTASERALNLTIRSGATATLHVAWGAVGANLLRLGRLDEAVVRFRKAQALVPEPDSNAAAALGRDIVNAEIARDDIAAAETEATRLMTVAEAPAQ